MQDDVTRRDFVSMTVAASIAAAATGADSMAQQRVVETNVEIKTADGVCDAAFIHPANGAHPAVIIWPDADLQRSRCGTSLGKTTRLVQSRTGLREDCRGIRAADAVPGYPAANAVLATPVNEHFTF